MAADWQLPHAPSRATIMGTERGPKDSGWGVVWKEGGCRRLGGSH